MNTITVRTEVDVDLDDYADEFLETLSDDELLKELQSRKVSVSEEAQVPFLGNMNKENAKRFLCTLVGQSFCVSNEQLIMPLKNTFKKQNRQ